ncbi:hypothetical protein JXB01_03900, partial [Candidatus Micrarchaeota archaeon]|nr:hypothetical protein [Candidatus Micrarchaeota archaeon]
MEWVNTFTRDYSVQYCDAVFRAIGSEGKGICSGIRKQLFHPHNKNEGHFIEKQEWNFLIGKLNKLLENNSSLEKEINIFHQKGKEYTGIAFKLNRLDLPNIAGSQLLKIYKEFFLCWRDYTSYLWEMFVLNDVISEKSGELLKQKQRSYEQNQFNEFMNYVSSPSNKSELFVLNDKLRKLKLDYTEDKFLKIWNDYKWLSCLDLHNAPLSKDKMHEYYDNLPEEREKAYANFELSEQEKRLIELNRKFIHIKDARDDYRRKGIFYVQPLFAEVGKRLGLNLKDVSMLTYDEIFSCLSGENKASILQEMIEKRKQGFMLFKNKEKIECVAG